METEMTGSDDESKDIQLKKTTDVVEGVGNIEVEGTPRPIQPGPTKKSLSYAVIYMFVAKQLDKGFNHLQRQDKFLNFSRDWLGLEFFKLQQPVNFVHVTVNIDDDEIPITDDEDNETTELFNSGTTTNPLIKDPIETETINSSQKRQPPPSLWDGLSLYALGGTWNQDFSFEKFCYIVSAFFMFIPFYLMLTAYYISEFIETLACQFMLHPRFFRKLRRYVFSGNDKEVKDSTDAINKWHITDKSTRGAEPEDVRPLSWSTRFGYFWLLVFTWLFSLVFRAIEKAAWLLKHAVKIVGYLVLKLCAAIFCPVATFKEIRQKFSKPGLIDDKIPLYWWKIAGVTAFVGFIALLGVFLPAMAPGASLVGVMSSGGLFGWAFHELLMLVEFPYAIVITILLTVVFTWMLVEFFCAIDDLFRYHYGDKLLKSIPDISQYKKPGDQSYNVNMSDGLQDDDVIISNNNKSGMKKPFIELEQQQPKDSWDFKRMLMDGFDWCTLPKECGVDDEDLNKKHVDSYSTSTPQ